MRLAGFIGVPITHSCPSPRCTLSSRHLYTPMPGRCPAIVDSWCSRSRQPCARQRRSSPAARRWRSPAPPPTDATIGPAGCPWRSPARSRPTHGQMSVTQKKWKRKNPNWNTSTGLESADVGRRLDRPAPIEHQVDADRRRQGQYDNGDDIGASGLCRPPPKGSQRPSDSHDPGRYRGYRDGDRKLGSAGPATRVKRRPCRRCSTRSLAATGYVSGFPAIESSPWSARTAQSCAMVAMIPAISSPVPTRSTLRRDERSPNDPDEDHRPTRRE